MEEIIDKIWGLSKFLRFCKHAVEKIVVFKITIILCIFCIIKPKIAINTWSLIRVFGLLFFN